MWNERAGLNGHGGSTGKSLQVQHSDPNILLMDPHCMTTVDVLGLHVAKSREAAGAGKILGSHRTVPEVYFARCAMPPLMDEVAWASHRSSACHCAECPAGSF